jgi:hypothetical protein
LLSSVAVPDNAKGQLTPPTSVVAAPAAVQTSVEPDSVPVPVPVTSIDPRHLALNVPDPELSERLVTVHLKFVHVFCAVETAVEAQVP